MSATIKPQLKVLGRDVGLGDWIAINSHGVMKFGKVKDLRHDRHQWRHVELVDSHGGRHHESLNDHQALVDSHGGRHHESLNDHQAYALFTFGNDDSERYDAELIHMMRGIGRALSQRYARMAMEKIVSRSCGDFKYTARDGRLVFKDGSRLRINADETRTVFNDKDEIMEWPQLPKIR